MLHSSIDSEKQMIELFLLNLKKEQILLGKSVNEEEIGKFEKNKDVKLPSDLRLFLRFINGFADYEMYKMSRLWRLEEFTNLIDYFNAAIIKEIETDIPHSVYKPLVKRNGEWQIPNAKSFFLFGDYNVNGSYWAIELKKGAYTDTSVISITDISNNYRVVANSFNEFLYTYINQSAEELL